MISSNPFSIVNLVNSLESIYLAELENSLDREKMNVILASTNADVYRMVIKMACTWISRGFVGFLNVRELLLLWDNVVASNDLYLMVILAVRYLLSHPWEKLWGRSGITTEKDLKASTTLLHVVKILTLKTC